MDKLKESEVPHTYWGLIPKRSEPKCANFQLNGIGFVDESLLEDVAMIKQKSIGIICTSVHHNNTRRLAEALADVLGGPIHSVEEAKALAASTGCEKSLQPRN